MLRALTLIYVEYDEGRIADLAARLYTEAEGIQARFKNARGASSVRVTADEGDRGKLIRELADSGIGGLKVSIERAERGDHSIKVFVEGR